MSRLTDLLRAASQLDPQLAKDLEEEIAPLQKRLRFGLNFERHAPEAVELPGHKIRKMSKVRLLPPRGTAQRGDLRVWSVDAVKGKIADISTLNGSNFETTSVPLDDLVLVAEFRDRIYPGLRPDGTVENSKDKPFHTVINGENFHVLEQLTFTHEKSVDVIYIDPPYNSGARDWKYNNDYVEGDDLYRHSKWLAFMERRLRLAKRLLKPEDSILIVTIDEKEYLRLGLLLEQLFPEAQIQMVSTVINRKGNARRGEFSRCDEYLFFVRFGGAALAPGPSDMLHEDKDIDSGRVRWKSLLRLASTGQTKGRFNLFYPLFFDRESLAFISAGDPLPEGVDIKTVAVPEGQSVLWPISKDGSDGRWSLSRAKFDDYVRRGYVKFGKKNAGGRTPYYLMSGQVEAIDRGDLVVVGRDDDGAVVLEAAASMKQPMTIWNQNSHSTSGHGTSLLRSLLPGRTFPYPKSLYAVEDALRFCVGKKPHAVVLDFFAGSGTTAHAVMRLNKQDGGHRQCISVTNNEVSAEEQTELRRQGLRPGDPEWEKLGICDYITKPRIRASITGRTPDGEPIKGDYKFVDEFPMSVGFEENAAFFTLTYESKWLVGVDRAFAAIAPMLWLRAGAVGQRIDSVEGGWAITDSYGILRDLDDSAAFIETLRTKGNVRIAYIVTDDEGRYQQVADEIRGIETVRLYEDYLRNFQMTGDF
ncbi:DNA methyltransferase [Glutamicibacter sp. 0426]|uniref:DNA methyltransferase n=1 Tax=Glutamicibacter sp. 0426 TaxID=1913445 RepID=UPI000939F3CD|nr:DNA methyltransferase [Glutamicibacter sp. 0426]